MLLLIFFKNTCSANNVAQSDFLQNKGLELFEKLKDSNDIKNGLVTVEELSIIVSKLKKGKASGYDGLMAEHIIHAHPVVVCFFTKLFNMMLSNGYVPDDFGIGITVPIPKSNSSKCNWSVKDFRGITISPIISKIFENCILLKFGSLLNSSCYQFGFKKGSGCRDVLFTLKNVVNYYANNGSTINLCTLDVTKAFDRLNIYGLVPKLVERKVPKSVIKIILNWYGKSSILVKWHDVLSNFVQLSHGVRQGGVLSPILFALYVDEMLCKLNNSNLGCKFEGFPLAAIMYADDLI